jgi:transposase
VLKCERPRELWRLWSSPAFVESDKWISSCHGPDLALFEPEQDYPSQWAAIRSFAEESGMAEETLRTWVRAAERDEGRRPALTTDERSRLCDLEREVEELRRAEILKVASGFLRGSKKLCLGRDLVGVGKT